MIVQGILTAGYITVTVDILNLGISGMESFIVRERMDGVVLGSAGSPCVGLGCIYLFLSLPEPIGNEAPDFTDSLPLIIFRIVARPDIVGFIVEFIHGGDIVGQSGFHAVVERLGGKGESVFPENCEFITAS